MFSNFMLRTATPQLFESLSVVIQSFSVSLLDAANLLLRFAALKMGTFPEILEPYQLMYQFNLAKNKRNTPFPGQLMRKGMLSICMCFWNVLKFRSSYSTL